MREIQQMNINRKQIIEFESYTYKQL